ncbi:MAG: hypothetical protein GXP10_04510 [Gammaproteobacteria bacterium]|nr:hypothetical protein [Gammaproteobacteria bacterium]
MLSLVLLALLLISGCAQSMPRNTIEEYTDEQGERRFIFAVEKYHYQYIRPTVHAEKLRVQLLTKHIKAHHYCVNGPLVTERQEVGEHYIYRGKCRPLN